MFTKICLIAVLAAVLSPVLQADSPAGLSPQAQKEIAALTEERNKTHEALETTENRATHLEAGLAVLLAVVGVVITVLVVTTIYGEIRLKQSVAELKRKAKEVADRFPQLAEMEKQSKGALIDLERIFAKGDWLEERYSRLDLMQRQRIFSVEHLIALEFVGSTTLGQLRGMANFYASKYKAEGRKSAFDFDRALYYVTLALDRGKRKFQHLNDAGLLWLLHSDTVSDPWPDLDEAEKYFEESGSKHPKQQRCYYNLGVIWSKRAIKALKEGRAPEAFAISVKIQKQLEAASKLSNWEIDPDPALASLIDYNLACAYCKVAQLDTKKPAATAGQDSRFDEACGYLEKASHFKQTKESTLDEDLKDAAKGDLYMLAQNTHYAAKISKVYGQFQQSWES